MSLNFQKLYEILKNEFGLEIRTSDSGKYLRHSYYIKNRFIYNRKSEVFREVAELKNGGVGGYLYVGHLTEYDKHTLRDKGGFLKIGSLTEDELRKITAKVTKEYK